MSIRDLFDKKTPYSVVSATDMTDLGRQVESVDNIKEKYIERRTFIPDVDYSAPGTFAKFGSAEKYYKDSLERVYTQYPYDGSLKERTEFLNQSTFLDTYILAEEYPRRNGFVSLAADGAHWLPGGFIPLTAPGFDEYIEFFGGPHGPSHPPAEPCSAAAPLSDESVEQQFKWSNKWDPEVHRGNNLRMDNAQGTSIEFWFKQGPQFPPGSGLGSRQYLLDMISGSARQLIALESSSAGPINFRIRQDDGITNTVWLSDDLSDLHSWHHYAFTSVNSGSGTAFKFYIDGVLTTTDSSATQKVGVDFISGTLGALCAPQGGGARGDGKTSGSFDEFRYWKTHRSSEDIGRYWFTQIGGGTNTDTANTHLGVYYKFNEGITGNRHTDGTTLDYSGRVSNGSWIGYPGSNARSIESAIVEAGAAKFEFKDPIMYPFHPAVQKLYNTLTLSGSLYDRNNNSAIFSSLPYWIVEEDEESNSNLLELTQILSSYLDTLYLQIDALPRIKDRVYDLSYIKPAPFSNKLLESNGLQAPEIFVDSSIIAQILNRDEDREFQEQLEDIKNLIYKNIYNNLIYIYKSKGTMKSLRNLIHCYGIDTDLIRINAYGNNVTYTFEDNFRPKAERKKFIDFNDPDRFIGTVYQQTASGNPNSTSLITGSCNNPTLVPCAASESDVPFLAYTSFTHECEVIFPHKWEISDPEWFRTPFLSASIYGYHLANAADQEDFTWTAPDIAWGLQAYAVRDKLESKNAYFQLRSIGANVNLTSSLFYDIYDNKKWNLAIRVTPQKMGMDLVSGSTDGPMDPLYLIEFYGVNSEVDIVANEFYLTQSIGAGVLGTSLLTSAKRIYAGAHHENFTGSILTRTDLKISSVRYWASYLDNETIRAHARDGSNFGTKHPYKSTYLYPTSLSDIHIPQVDTLALNWNFNNVTSSGDGLVANARDAGFEVQDLSSGSLELTSSYKHFGEIVNLQHTGRGDFFLANDPKVVDLRYVYSGKQTIPEVVYSSDMIQIMSSDDVVFTKDSRPVDYYFQIEKSMYQNISDEMLNIFATIVDFNNLIGEPVNRYRLDYKAMEKLRQLFFRRVQEVSSLDAYIKFYEWIDASLNIMLQQLLPASANFSDNIRHMVESHVLERNKYQTKFPTLEMIPTDPEAGINGINELLYNWKFGHAPLPGPSGVPSQDESCFWWKERANRASPVLSSGDSHVDFDKNQYLSASLQVLERSYTTPYRFKVDEVKEIRGGVNFSRNKKIDYIRPTMKFGTTDGVSVGEVKPLPICDDVYNPLKKSKLDFKAIINENSYFSGKGDLFVPFSLYSSSLHQKSTNIVVTPGIGAAEVTNLHTDTYGDDKDVPMQGPFTDYAVGGLQYRHVEPLRFTERMEGWRFEGNKFIYPRVNQPRGVYYRDLIAKRPVNIRNIHHTTGSRPNPNPRYRTTIIGNYDQIYDVVQTCGRYTNNHAFVKAGGFNLVPALTYSDYVLDIAAIQYAKVQRGRTPWVFVNRFSAPGGPDTAGDANGGPGLDRYSGEYSSRNDLNYRNNFTRQVLQWLYTSHVGQFGYYTNSQNINGLPGSAVNPFNYAGTGSLYQVNRNPNTRLVSGSKSFQCKKVYDNYYINHPIPQSDCQYAWTKKSVDKHCGVPKIPPADCEGAYFGCACPLGYWPYSGEVNGVDAVAFVSGSDFGSYIINPRIWGAHKQKHGGFVTPRKGFLFTDFAGLNTNIQEPIHALEAFRGLYPENSALIRNGMSENFISRSAFVANRGLNPEVWEVDPEMELRENIAQNNWILAFSGLTGPRYLQTVQTYQTPLTITIRYAQGAWEDGFSSPGYDLDPTSQFGPTYKSMNLLYSEDNGTTWLTQSAIDARVIPTFNPDARDQGETIGFQEVSFSYLTGRLKFKFQQDPANYNSTVNWGLDQINISGPEYLNRTFVPLATTGSGPVYTAQLFNSLILHRQGPYGWPTWKQIRGYQNPLVRYYRNNNLITCNSTPGKIRLIEDGKVSIRDRFAPMKIFKEPAVTSQPALLRHTLGTRIKMTGPMGTPFATVEPLTILHTFGNNLDLFTTKELNFCTHVGKCDYSAYDLITSWYLNGQLEQNELPIYSFIEMRYMEQLYPAASNAYQKHTRQRIGYNNDYWKDNRAERTLLGKTKWGGL